MNESHPFVKWWTNKSRWHNPGEDWKASLACAEGNLAIEAWNAALLEVHDLKARDAMTLDDVFRLAIPTREHRLDSVAIASTR